MELNPVKALAEQYKAFRQRGPEILALRHQVSQLSYAAKQQGDAQTVQELTARASDLTKLHNDWQDTNGKARDLISKLPASVRSEFGLGVAFILPAAIAAGVAAVIAAMVAINAKYRAQKALVDAVRDRILTPEEAAQLAQSGGGGIGAFFGGMGTTALLALGAIAFLALRRR
jgi:hypothetical protein